MFRYPPSKGHGSHQFISGQLGGFVTGVEAQVGHSTLAPNGYEDQLRFIHQQRRQRIRRRRGIDDIAPDGSAILIDDSSGPGSGASSQRKLTSYDFLFT